MLQKGNAQILVIALAMLAMVLFDRRPYAVFLVHLTRLLGGEAFSAFKYPTAVAINYSIPGLVLKLKLFGVPAMSFAISKVVGWVYTLGILAATIVLARREREATRVTVWLAIPILATFSSRWTGPSTCAGSRCLLIIAVA